MDQALTTQLVHLAYLAASILFILCLRGLSSPEQGRRGIFLGELGMLIAVIATLLQQTAEARMTLAEVRREWPERV